MSVSAGSKPPTGVDRKPTTYQQAVSYPVDTPRRAVSWAQSAAAAESLATRSATAVTDKELKMAQALIESMSDSWEPEKYRDEYRTALLEIIEQKAKNKQIATKAPAPPTPTNVVDLVKVLQDSLNRSQSVKPKRGAARSNGRRSTATLVKQKRRAGALG